MNAKVASKEVAEIDLNSKERLLHDFSIISGAAIGVMVMRTKEPYRMMEGLKDLCRDKKLQFNVWKITSGWNKYKLELRANDEDDIPTANDATQDIIPALQYINQIVPEGDEAKGHLWCMMWPHYFCKKDGTSNIPHITQYLADYSQLFTGDNKRLIIIAPIDYALPAELEDCVTLIDCDLPHPSELREAYDDLNEFATTKNKKLEYKEAEINRILAAGAGMTIIEFESTISRAIKKFVKRIPDVPIDKFVQYVSITKAEIVKRSDVLELMPIGKMEDVGGLENLKAWITLRKHAFEKKAREYGVDKPRGCALIGPPGTGKSLCAKAVAHTLGIPLVRFDVSRVFAGIVGASEGRVREALKMIKAMAPCVVMLDEVDKAFDVNASSGDSGVGKRILGAILTDMQENQADVFWVMTANRVGGLPPELLRKGRLDEVFSVSVPNEKECADILRIHLKRRKVDIKKLDIAKIAESCAGFVGAEIENAVAEAVLISYATDVDVTDALIIDQFENLVPLSVAHKEQFNSMQEWADQNAKPASEGKAKPRERMRKGSSSAGIDVGKRRRKIDSGSLDS